MSRLAISVVVALCWRRRPPGRSRRARRAGCGAAERPANTAAGRPEPGRGCARHLGDSRHHRGGRHRYADPPRAGACLGPGRALAAGDHRRAGTFRDQGSARGQLHDQRAEGRLRLAAVRATAAFGSGHADRSRRRSDDRQADDRAAARQRDHRPHHRRIRRAGGECHGDGAALRLHRRRQAADARRRPELARHDRRPGSVPAFRAVTG